MHHQTVDAQARIKVDVGPRQRIIVGQSDLTGTGSLP
jgi:hypothetical protein